jgi:hypothetical protein
MITKDKNVAAAFTNQYLVIVVLIALFLCVSLREGVRSSLSAAFSAIVESSQKPPTVTAGTPEGSKPEVNKNNSR